MYNFLKLKWNEKKHTYKCIYFFFNTTGSLKSNSYRYLKSQSNKLFQLQTNKTIFILFLSLIKTFILFFFCYDKPNFFFNILFWPTFHNRKKEQQQQTHHLFEFDQVLRSITKLLLLLFLFVIPILISNCNDHDDVSINYNGIW